MALDADVERMLALLASLRLPPLTEGTPEAARRALRRVTVDVRLADAAVDVGKVADTTFRGPAGRQRARVYRPEGRTPPGGRPTIAFFHGGGFVIGDLDTHDAQCRWLCREVDAVVVSVDYRRAPEDPFPAAVEDCLAATRWVAERVARLGGDADRIVVAGDSAGGNLAAVIAQAWREEVGRGRPPLAAQLLVYPAVDLEDEGGERYPSRVDHAEGYFLTGDDLRWFGDHYLGAHADRRDPRLSPLFGELEGLPPAVVVTAEFDPLRDEAEAYAAALEEAGVDVVLRRFDGLIHGFFELSPLSPACAEAVQLTCSLLRDLLDEPARPDRG